MKLNKLFKAAFYFLSVGWIIMGLTVVYLLVSKDCNIYELLFFPTMICLMIGTLLIGVFQINNPAFFEYLTDLEKLKEDRKNAETTWKAARVFINAAGYVLLNKAGVTKEEVEKKIKDLKNERI